MDYLNRVIKSLLKEQAEQENIIDAIKKHYEVEIDYMPDANGKGGGKRVIQPVAYGTTTAGNMAVRAFQPFGDSASNNKPYWRLFLIDKINNWKTLKQRRFSEPPGFNESGDDKMSNVMMIADFDNSRYERGGLKKHNDDVHARKVEENPYYDLGRNIKKSYDGNRMDYLRKNIEDWKRSQAANEFNKGNGQSLYDMSVANNFGEEENSETQTVGPISKGNIEKPNTTTSKVDYSNARNNGPVFKDNSNEINNRDKEDNDNEGFQQHNGESAEVDAR